MGAAPVARAWDAQEEWAQVGAVLDLLPPPAQLLALHPHTPSLGLRKYFLPLAVRSWPYEFGLVSINDPHASRPPTWTKQSWVLDEL